MRLYGLRLQRDRIARRGFLALDIACPMSLSESMIIPRNLKHIRDRPVTYVYGILLPLDALALSIAANDGKLPPPELLKLLLKILELSMQLLDLAHRLRGGTMGLGLQGGAEVVPSLDRLVQLRRGPLL